MQTTSGQSTKTLLSQRVFSVLSPQRLSLAIISFGALVRIVQYLSNRSLWADEAVLALNIVNRSYLELLQPLDYDQGAPLGFLWIEKLAVQLFGNNEYALRLFPLVSGILSLLLFYELTKRYLRPQAIPVALVLFASLRHIVYYSSEVKQYSTDIAITLFCFLMASYLSQEKLSFKQTVVLSVLGAIAIWFSHPAIFVLAGVGICSWLIKFAKKERIRVINLLAIYSTWLLSFALFYFISLKTLSSNENLLTSWQNKSTFPSSILDLIWPLDSLGKFFYEPLGFTSPMDGLAIVAFIIGCFSFFHRKKAPWLILLSPLFATFFAAYLHKYPFGGRLVLFLTPFFIVPIAEGVDYLWFKSRSSAGKLVWMILLVLLIYTPLANASHLFVEPRLKSDIKPVITYIKENQQPGDILYIYQRGEYQFKYYAKKYGYQEGDYIIGVDDLDNYDGVGVSETEWQRYKSDLDKLRGHDRVWVLFSHAWVKEENQMIKSYLDTIGKPIDVFQSRTPKSFVYLYDLNSN
jgi:4-amino-4-deoxy-L-arabinose transferase-like glycosyltransferase